ncbi:MAG: hypothetical protein ABSF26_02440 [Thermoguttaceae bacterium]|jgi:hypothetical protein
MAFLRPIVVAAAVLGLVGPAHAGSAYYNIPIKELKFVEGSLPRGEATNWREAEWTAATWLYAALDQKGEVYVVGQGGSDDSWDSPYPLAAPVTPAVVAEPLSGRPSNPVGPGTHLLIRADEGKDLSGWLFVPRSNHTGMMSLRFTIPAAAAKPEAKEAFYRGKTVHYEWLHARDIPGGAWFRHKARQARAELNLPPPPDAVARPQWRTGRADELTRTYDLFTGGQAMSENLQLDRALPPRPSNETPVKLDSLAGITVQEIDWKPLLAGAQPALDPLAAKIPADQHVVFFRSFQAALAMADETGQHDTPVLRWAQPRSVNTRVVERYQRQLGLSMSTVARLLGPTLAESVALTGSDPYFPTGTDVAVLLESPQPDLLAGLLLTKIALAAAGAPGAKPVHGAADGLDYRGFASPDRSTASYVAQLDGAVVVSNSLYQLGRLAAVRSGRSKSISALPEYAFFRQRYSLSDPDETALLFLSDPTIRRWCGPQWRIADSRRTRAAAVLAELQAAQLPALVAGSVKPGPIYTDLPILGGGELQLTPRGVASSVYGTPTFMTPIGELALEEVTRAEADAYQQWRGGYQRNWSWAFDPIALRISLGKTRVAADLTVMPLIASSEYREMISIARGAKIEPAAGDPHEALAQFVLAINRESPTIRSAENFAATMGQAVALGWLGSSLSVYADDDPFWKDLAGVKDDELGKFMEKNVGRLPVAVRIDVSNPLKLAVFLTSARAFIEQAAPGLTHWEALRYKEQPYTRITPVKGRSPLGAELENLAIYYTSAGGALTVTLSEAVLRRAIDRGQAAADKPVAAAAEPWLGTSAALRVEGKILEIANAVGHRQYQRLMQTQCWNNLPILNEWRRLYPERDPVEVQRAVWGVELVCPGGGKYRWSEKSHGMESTVYGSPAEPQAGPAAPPVLGRFAAADFGLTLENQGLRARAVLVRPKP